MHVCVYIYIYVFISHSFFIHLYIHGYLGSLHIFVFLNNATMNMGEHASFWNSVFIFFGKIPRIGTAEWDFFFFFFFLSFWGCFILFSLAFQVAPVAKKVKATQLWSHGLYSPWNSPGQNTGVSSCSLLQGFFPPRNWTQASCIAGGFFTIWAMRED